VTLLEEIQNSAVDAQIDLATLLRKCKLLAARLGNQPLED
jgi:AbiTii